MIPATIPEQKRGILEGDSELDRTVILSNEKAHQLPKVAERSGAFWRPCEFALLGAILVFPLIYSVGFIVTLYSIAPLGTASHS